MTPSVELLHGDCLEQMSGIASGSVDMVLCDLPYGTTVARWDAVIPFEPLWRHYRRIVKKNGAIVLTATQPFTAALVMSNLPMFRYEWIWHKTVGSNPLVVSFQPFKKHENICVFYRAKPTYNPQWDAGAPYSDTERACGLAVQRAAGGSKKAIRNDGRRYPGSVQLFRNPNNGNMHPTQKPVALLEYLIRTYTNPGDVVLDNAMGSGSTGVACLNTGRRFIGIEKDEAFFRIAADRIAAAMPAPAERELETA